VKRSLFFSPIVSFLLAVFIFSFVGLNFYISLLFLFVFGFSVIFLWRKKEAELLFISCFGLSFFFLGASRVAYLQNLSELKKDLPIEKEKVVLLGKVLEVEETSVLGKKIIAESDSLVVGGKVLNFPTQKVLLRVESAEEFSYGEVVTAEGVMQRIKNYEPKEGERSFDYEYFQKTNGIFFEIYNPEIEKTGVFRGNVLKVRLLKLKEWFVSNINSALSPIASSLVSGMTISGKASLPKTLEENFAKAGIIHIVVLSGFNIAILVRFCQFFLRRFGRRTVVFGGVILLVLFIIMAGGEPPLIRAGVMASIILLSKNSGSKAVPLRVLVFAGASMVFLNPFILVGSPSFILSFLATLAVIWIAPILEKKFLFVTEKAGLREIVASSVAVMILVYPYIAFSFGQISLVSLLTNILVLPIVSFVMLLGLFVGLFGGLGVVAYPFVVLAEILISYIILVVDVSLLIPFASVEVGEFSFYILLLIYAMIVFLILKLKKNSSIPTR
jgi:competence protein ComEC